MPSQINFFFFKCRSYLNNEKSFVLKRIFENDTKAEIYVREQKLKRLKFSVVRDYIKIKEWRYTIYNEDY